MRSILVGFVAAFDKHFNLALVDVDEIVLLRPATIKRQTLAMASDLAAAKVKCNEQTFLAEANCAQNETKCNSSVAAVETFEVEPTENVDAAADERAVDNACAVDVSDGDTGRIGGRSKRTKPSQKTRRNRQNMTLTSTSQRFVSQLFVRGENVVLITFADINVGHNINNNNHNNNNNSSN